MINLDASARSASRIFVLHKRFLIFENVYIYIYIYIFFFFQKVGAGARPLSPSPFVGPDMKTLRY